MAQEMIQRGMGKHISRRHAARLLKKGAFNRTGSALGSHQYPIRNGRRSFLRDVPSLFQRKSVRSRESEPSVWMSSQEYKRESDCIPMDR